MMLVLGNTGPKTSDPLAYRNEPNYVKPVYVNDTATVILAEGQTTDGVRMELVDEQNEIVQFHKEERYQGVSDWSSYALKKGEEQGLCPTVAVIDIVGSSAEMRINWSYCR